MLFVGAKSRGTHIATVERKRQRAATHTQAYVGRSTLPCPCAGTIKPSVTLAPPSTLVVSHDHWYTDHCHASRLGARSKGPRRRVGSGSLWPRRKHFAGRSV